MENPELPKYTEEKYPRPQVKRRAGAFVTLSGVVLACVLIVGGLFVVGFILFFAVAMSNFGSNK